MELMQKYFLVAKLEVNGELYGFRFRASKQYFDVEKDVAFSVGFRWFSQFKKIITLTFDAEAQLFFSNEERKLVEGEPARFRKHMAVRDVTTDPEFCRIIIAGLGVSDFEVLTSTGKVMQENTYLRNKNSILNTETKEVKEQNRYLNSENQMLWNKTSRPLEEQFAPFFRLHGVTLESLYGLGRKLQELERLQREQPKVATLGYSDQSKRLALQVAELTFKIIQLENLMADQVRLATLGYVDEVRTLKSRITELTDSLAEQVRLVTLGNELQDDLSAVVENLWEYSNRVDMMMPSLQLKPRGKPRVYPPDQFCLNLLVVKATTALIKKGTNKGKEDWSQIWDTLYNAEEYAQVSRTYFTLITNENGGKEPSWDAMRERLKIDSIYATELRDGVTESMFGRDTGIGAYEAKSEEFYKLIDGGKRYVQYAAEALSSRVQNGLEEVVDQGIATVEALVKALETDAAAS